MGSTRYSTLLEYGYCQDKPWLDIVTPKQQPTAVAWDTAASKKTLGGKYFQECSSVISDAPVRIFYIHIFFDTI